jgi:ATP/maltotriose-dependent transcriptional regulator MalT
MFLERHDSALHHLGRGLRLCRRTGHTTMLADLFAASAYVLLALGRLDEAADHTAEALVVASLVGSGEACLLAAAVDAAIEMWRGDFTVAITTCRQSLAGRGPGPRPGRAALTGMLGQALLLTGDADACVRSVIEAGGGRELPGLEAPVRPLWFRVLATAELARADLAAAERWALAAARTAPPGGPPGRRGHALLAQAEIQRARNDPAAASTACEAAESFSRARMPLYEATAHIVASSALIALGRCSDARSALQRAQDLADACGASGLRALADQEYGRTVSDDPRRDGAGRCPRDAGGVQGEAKGHDRPDS